MNLESTAIRRRLGKVFAASVFLMLFGTIGYEWLSPGKSGLDCLFQTVVIVTTLGVEKVVNVSDTPQAKLFTMVLILSGVSIGAYGFTSFTAFVIEGDLTNLLGRRRMDREIARLSGHQVVCGAGRTGLYIIRELMSMGRPFVIIDKDEEALKEIASEGPALYLVGDGTDEHVLMAAGLDRAAGLLATLGSDPDNLFLVLTARNIRPELRIVARAYNLTARPKLKRAGADAVVYPNLIGGMRMVSEMVRPAVVSFLDQMLREGSHQVRFEEVIVNAESDVSGQTIAQARILDRTGLLIIACHEQNGEFIYNPPPDTMFHPGMVLIVMGEIDQVERLRKLVE